MKRFTIILTAAILALSTGCTENIRARAYGGTTTIDLPKGEKLVNATWKNSNLWYLTRKAKAGEHPESLTFQEKSSYGLVEGTIIFNEH